jgi:hypothetical protein
MLLLVCWSAGLLLLLVHCPAAAQRQMMPQQAIATTDSTARGICTAHQAPPAACCAYNHSSTTGNWGRSCAPEEVHATLVDAQDQLGGQQPYGVLDALHQEEHRVAIWERAQDAQELDACLLLGELLQSTVAAQHVLVPLLSRPRHQHLWGSSTWAKLSGWKHRACRHLGACQDACLPGAGHASHASVTFQISAGS